MSTLNNPDKYLATFGREGEAPRHPATFQLPQNTLHQELRKLVKRGKQLRGKIKKISTK